MHTSTSAFATPGSTGEPSARGRAWDDRLRLVKFVASFERGGTEQQFVTLGLALDAGRFDLRFGCLRRRGALLKTLSEREIPTPEYAFRSFCSVGYPRQAIRLARDLSRDRVQIVHAYNYYGNAMAVPVARAAGVPVVIASIRDRGVYLTPNQKRVQRYVCRLADCVLVNADSVRDWLVEEGYDAARIRVIRNGIDLSCFSERTSVDGQPSTGIRRELGLDPASPLLAVVARLNPSKGLEYLLEAAVQIGARHPDARCLIVGDGDPTGTYRATLEDRVRALGLTGRVLFAGERSDVPAILREVTISVLPSLSEAMPNGVLESMAAGVPVVATRVGGISEAIDDGTTGLLVPPADSAALAEAIGRMLDAPGWADQLGRAGRQAVAERFSVERMVRSTEELYQELVARKRATATRWNPPLVARAARKVE
jgi:glycosyltransferase involved in cell wall biosynthesis